MSIAADGNPAMTPPDGSAVTILVADDDLPNRLVLKSMLARAGYQVLIAENGAEAVEAFTACAPALVLMDLMMPVLDGI
jgi:CheY-like chemotaxis protein